MSKSTPICELNNNNNNTRPIVADILKEIQAENSINDKDDYEKEQQKSFNYHTDNEIISNNMFENNIDGIDENENDINIENNDEISENDKVMSIKNNHSENTILKDYINNDYEDEDELTQNIEKIPIIDKEYEKKNDLSFIDKYINLDTLKDPIIVFLVSMIILTPYSDKLLSLLHLGKFLPFINNSLGNSIIKALLASVLYFLLKKYV